MQHALDRAAAGRTTISVAHRLSTIKGADQIVVMGKGEILEIGTHNELLEKDGAYAALVSAQKLKEEEAGEDAPADDEASRAREAEEAEAAELKARGTLKRTGTGRSETSQILDERQRAAEVAGKTKERGVSYLLYRMIAEIWPQTKWYYMLGAATSVLLGCVYPVSGLPVHTGHQVLTQVLASYRYLPSSLADSSVSSALSILP